MIDVCIEMTVTSEAALGCESDKRGAMNHCFLLLLASSTRPASLGLKPFEEATQQSIYQDRTTRRKHLSCGMATANESTVKTTKPQLLDASVLAGFKLKRVLNEDPRTRSAALLGTFAKRPLKKNEDEDVRVTEDAAAAGDRDQDEDEEQAVLLLEKTPFNQSFYASVGSTLDDPVNGNDSDGSKRRKLEGQEDISEGSTTAAMASTLSSSTSLVNFSRLESLGENDIYLWLLAHSRASEATSSATADMKLTLIRPATQAHIVKFSHQEKVMVYETPEMYRAKTLPWLEETQVGDRLKWVQNILQGKKEQENVLWRDSDPESGFVVSIFEVPLPSNIAD